MSNRAVRVLALVVFFTGLGLFFGPAVSQRSSSTSLASLSVRLKPGSVPEPFTLNDLSGRSVSLESLKGKTVLINFWATWCVPCVAEMPAMENLYRELKQEDFEIVAISLDNKSSRPTLEKFVEDKEISFTILHDHEGKVGSLFGVEGIPESFFLNSAGEFVAFPDPVLGASTVRLVSDRPWDSKEFVASVKTILETY